jgi:copper chaperone CopZ
MLALSALCFALLATPPVEAKKAAAKAPNTVLKIENLTKATKAKEVKKLEKELKKVKGVTSVVVAKKKSEAKIWHRPEATMDLLKAAVTKAGFKLAAAKDEEVDEIEDAPYEDAGDEPEEGF